MTRSDLRAALGNPNVAAFLRAIRTGETHPDDDEAYRALFGWSPGNGKTFDSFDDHPRQAFKSAWGWTSAAGAYQAMCAVPGRVKTDTWGDFVRSCGPSDFSPESQDLFAVWCVRRRKALEDVLAGRFEVAVAKCAREWASLPGSPYGQPTVTMDRLRAVYTRYGGTFESEASADPDTQPPAPVEDAIPLPPIETEAPMALPFLIPAAQALIGIAPDLIRIFGNGSQISERNAKVAEMVVEKAKEVTGAVSGEEAVTKLQADPRLAEQFRMSVREQQDAWLGMVVKLSEIEEGSRAKAREFNLQVNEPVFFRFSFVQLLSLLMLAISSFGGGYVLYGDFSEELKGAVVTLMLIGGYTAVQTFWLGSSFGSMTKNPQPPAGK